MVGRRIARVTDRRIPASVSERFAAVYINLWVDRQAEGYTNLLRTIAHTPRPIQGGRRAIS